jgi:hypothetical protein
MLRGGEDFIVCTLKDSISKSRSPYKTSLKIDIDYGYIESLSKELKITKITT